MDLMDAGKGLTLNTNGHCFICLDNTGKEKERSYSVISGLFRFLNVDYCETLSQQRHQNPHCLEKDHLKVELCIACKEKNKSFVELLTAMEKLEMEITDCLKTVQDRILEANDDSKKLREYRCKMTLSYMDKIDKLRDQVSEKCSKVIAGSFPRVILKKLNERDDDDVRKVRVSNTHRFSISPENKEEHNKDTTKGVQFGGFNTEKLKPRKNNPIAHHIKKEVVNFYHRTLDKRVVRDLSRSKSVVCNICQKVFKFRFALTVHMKQVHEKRRGHKCHKCNKTFSNPYSLRRHNEAIHLRLKYFCQVPGCSNKYGKKRDVLVHLKLQHPNFAGEVRFVRCQEKLEQRSFEEPGDVLENIEGEVSTDEPTTISFKESIEILSLGQTAIMSNSLQEETEISTHLTVQIENREVSRGLINQPPCTGFPKSATKNITQKDLDTELRSLGGVKNYKQALEDSITWTGTWCTICNQQFARNQNLVQHIKRIHLKELGTEKCDKCDKTFSTPYNLRLHRESTHLKIRHTCNFPGCAMKFAYEHTMIRHQKMKHSNYSGGITGATSKQGSISVSNISSTSSLSSRTVQVVADGSSEYVVKSEKEDSVGQDGYEFILPLLPD